MAGEFQGRQSWLQRVGSGVQSLIRQDQYGSLAVSQSMPKYLDMALSRKLFVASSAGGTAKAPVAAMPTTAAAFALYNPVGSGKRLVVLKGFNWLVSGTPGLGGAQLMCKTNVAQTAETTYSSSVKQAMASGVTAVGLFVGGITLTETPAWFVTVAKDVLATDNVGAGFVSPDLEGLIVLDEDTCCGLTIMGESGSTPLWGGGFIWAEIESDFS